MDASILVSVVAGVSALVSMIFALAVKSKDAAQTKATADELLAAARDLEKASQRLAELQAMQDPDSEQWKIPVGDALSMSSYSRGIALNEGASPALADDIARVALDRINEAVTTNRTILDMWAATSWRPYVAEVTRSVLGSYSREQNRRLGRGSASAPEADDALDAKGDLQDLLVAHYLEALSATLTPEEQQFVHLRYSLGRTVSEVADGLGVTKVRATQIGHSAIEKLRGLIELDINPK